MIGEENCHCGMASIFSNDTQLPAPVSVHARRNIQLNVTLLAQHIDRLVDGGRCFNRGSGEIDDGDTVDTGPLPNRIYGFVYVASVGGLVWHAFNRWLRRE